MKQILIISIAIVLSSTAYAQYPPVFVNYGNNTEVGQYANIRGFKMYYEIYGEGKPLLLIHGNEGSANNYTGQIPHFAQNHQVIIVDSRAHGKSIDNSDSLSYKMMAEDFNELLNYLKIDSCNIIGWSDGGNIALLLAINHPKKVNKIAITGANIWNDERAFQSDLLEVPKMVIDSLRNLPQTPEIRNSIKVWNLINQVPEITLQDLNKIKCPVLVIGGDHDVILPKHTLLMAENIPQSNLWILPNSGHSTLINYKEQFNSTVSMFFEKPFRLIKGYEHLD